MGLDAPRASWGGHRRGCLMRMWGSACAARHRSRSRQPRAERWVAARCSGVAFCVCVCFFFIVLFFFNLYGAARGAGSSGGEAHEEEEGHVGLAERPRAIPLSAPELRPRARGPAHHGPQLRTALPAAGGPRPPADLWLWVNTRLVNLPLASFLGSSRRNKGSEGEGVQGTSALQSAWGGGRAPPSLPQGGA